MKGECSTIIILSFLHKERWDGSLHIPEVVKYFSRSLFSHFCHNFVCTITNDIFMSFCFSLSLNGQLTFYLSLSLSLDFCLSVFLSVCLSLFLSLSLTLSVFENLCWFCLLVTLTNFLCSVYVFVSLSFSLSLFLSFSLSVSSFSSNENMCQFLSKTFRSHLKHLMLARKLIQTTLTSE